MMDGQMEGIMGGVGGWMNEGWRVERSDRRCICGKVEDCEGRRAEGERKDRCMNGQVGRWKGEREEEWKDVG